MALALFTLALALALALQQDRATDRERQRGKYCCIEEELCRVVCRVAVDPIKAGKGKSSALYYNARPCSEITFFPLQDSRHRSATLSV